MDLRGAGALADVARGEVVGGRTTDAGDEEEDGEDDRAHDEEQQDGGEEPADQVRQHEWRPDAAASSGMAARRRVTPSPTFRWRSDRWAEVGPEGHGLATPVDA